MIDRSEISRNGSAPLPARRCTPLPVSTDTSDLTAISRSYRVILEWAQREVQFFDPVIVSADPHRGPLLRAAVRKRRLPIDGILVHDWGHTRASKHLRFRFGAQLYSIEGISFVAVSVCEVGRLSDDLLVVERKNYQRL